MRYYSLHITDPKTGASIVPNSSGGFTRSTGPTFSSKAKMPFTGQLVDDPGALNLKLDVPVSQLAGMNVQLSASMSAGPPGPSEARDRCR